MVAISHWEEASPDDVRAAGWMVAIHNDYRLDGKYHTFWLFTKGSRFVKGEGITDRQALNIVRQEIRRLRTCGDDDDAKPTSTD